MKDRQQSTTSYPMCFLMVSSTDHVTPVTGLTPTVTISKNGGAFASPSGAVSEIGNGWYALAGNATDRNTLGDFLIHATGTGADPVDDRYSIVAYNPYDSVRLGLSALPNAAADTAGGLPISDTGGLDLDTLLTRLDAAISTRLASAGYTAPANSDIATILSRIIGTLATGTHNPQSGDAFSRIGAAGAGLTAIGDTRLSNLDAAISSRSSHSAADVWAVTTRTLSSFGTLVSDIATAVWSAGTRTLSGFGSLVADIWSYATRALTDKAGFTISGTKQTLDALNDVSSSTVRTQADAALTAYDAPTKAELDAAVAPLATSAALSAVDDYIDTEVAAIKAVTDKLDTAMESDGGVYRFTANALEEGPSGTSGGGDATAANQATIIAHLTDIKGAGFSGTTDSLESIRDRGDSAWITGSGLSGSNAVPITVQDENGVNIVEASVEVWDSAGTTFYERKTSDSSGQASFNMDDGTYAVKIHKAGYSIADQTLVVPDTLAPTYVMTAFVMGTPTDPNLCRIYIDITNVDGTIPATLIRSIEVISLPAEIDSKYLTDTNKDGVYNATTGRLYFDAVREATVRIKVEVCNIDQTGEVPDAAEAALSEVVFT